MSVDLEQILVLDDWHHPDVVTGQVASETAAFRSIAEVLASGDVGRYDPSEAGNTHWSLARRRIALTNIAVRRVP